MRTETVMVDLKFNVTRELSENEVLCPVCSGTSLHIQGIPLAQVTNGTYELNKFGKHNSIVGCNACYSGIQRKCKYCSRLLGRSSMCGCESESSEHKYEQTIKEKMRFEKAIKLMADDEISKGMGMYYSEYYAYNDGYFSEFEEFIEAWECDHEPDDDRPLYVWGTDYKRISLDADNIIENACDDLHEEAGSNIEDQDELQEFLDIWCAKQKGTDTYYMSNKYAIEIPWDDKN